MPYLWAFSVQRAAIVLLLAVLGFGPKNFDLSHLENSLEQISAPVGVPKLTTVAVVSFVAGFVVRGFLREIVQILIISLGVAIGLHFYSLSQVSPLPAEGLVVKLQELLLGFIWELIR